jgi:hypothetical protein
LHPCGGGLIAQSTRWGLALALLGAVLAPGVARAQSGFYLTPSVSLAEVYDDNLFFTARNRQGDLITRLTPAIEGRYESTRFSLLASYTLDSEVYAEHSELTTALARQQAGIDLRYTAPPHLTLRLTGGYQTTETPAELNVATGLQVGRGHAERIQASPSAAYRWSPLTGATADYTFTRDTLDASPPGVPDDTTVDTHVASLGVEHRLTELDTGTLGYSFRRFDFSGGQFGAPGATTAHVLAAGWTRDLTSRLRVALRAGPRVSEEEGLDVEASATIRYSLQRGEVSLAYDRTQATVIGQPGVVSTDTLSAGLTYDLWPSLRIRAAPSVSLSHGPASDARVYRLAVDLSYQLTRALTLTAGYELTLQQGTIGPPAPTDDDILHNVVLLRVTLSYPFRVH